MPDKDFQNEVLQQLGIISGKQDMMHEELRSQQGDIKELKTEATKALESAKSAHHRIDDFKSDIKKDAVIIGGIVAFFVSLMMKYFIR